MGEGGPQVKSLEGGTSSGYQGITETRRSLWLEQSEGQSREASEMSLNFILSVTGSCHRVLKSYALVLFMWGTVTHVLEWLKIFKSDNTQCWQGCRATVTLIHCWSDAKTV